jgi:hypothetical protein
MQLGQIILTEELVMQQCSNNNDDFTSEGICKDGSQTIQS